MATKRRVLDARSSKVLTQAWQRDKFARRLKQKKRPRTAVEQLIILFDEVENAWYAVAQCVNEPGTYAHTLNWYQRRLERLEMLRVKLVERTGIVIVDQRVWDGLQVMRKLIQ